MNTIQAEKEASEFLEKLQEPSRTSKIAKEIAKPAKIVTIKPVRPECSQFSFAREGRIMPVGYRAFISRVRFFI